MIAASCSAWMRDFLENFAEDRSMCWVYGYMTLKSFYTIVHTAYYKLYL